MDNVFFSGIAQREIPIRQYQGWAPLFFQDASLYAAVFLADAKAAQAFLPTPQHKLLQPFFGKALVAFHCFNYRQSQLGPYSEVSVSLAMHFGSQPQLSPLRLARSVLQRAYHAYVLQLPVDSEPALFGGLDYYNVPKYLADLSFTEGVGRQNVKVRSAAGRAIFQLTMPQLKVKQVPQESKASLHTMELSTYPMIDGKSHCARGELNLIRHRSQFFPRGIDLQLGDAAEADPLRALNLGRALQYLYAPSCQLILHLPRRL